MAKSSRAPRRHVNNTHNSGDSLLGATTPSIRTKGTSEMCWLFALARPAAKSRGRAMAGARWQVPLLAIAVAIAATTSEDAAGALQEKTQMAEDAEAKTRSPTRRTADHFHSY